MIFQEGKTEPEREREAEKFALDPKVGAFEVAQRGEKRREEMEAPKGKRTTVQAAAKLRLGIHKC